MQIDVIPKGARNLQVICGSNLDGDLATVEHQTLQRFAEYVAQGLAQAFKLCTHVWDTRQSAIVLVRLILF